MRCVESVYAIGLRLAWAFLIGCQFCLAASGQTLVAGSVSGLEERGFGRVIFAFPEPVNGTARMAGGVMIVTFDRPVRINPEKLPGLLPNYIAAVRLDPDQRSIRFAVTRPLRVDLKDAAEQLYLDIVPDEWQGALPPLPADVVKSLARRARAANDAIREAETRKAKPLPKPVIVRVAENGQRTRIVFELPPDGRGAMEHHGNEVIVSLSGPLSLDPAVLRAVLAGVVDQPEANADGERIDVTFSVPDTEILAVTEGDSFFVDILRKAPKPAEPKPTEAKVPVPPVAKAAEGAQRSVEMPVAQDGPEKPLEAQPAKPVNAPVKMQSTPALVTVSFEPEKDGVRLIFSPKVPMALFERSDEIWAVLQGPKTAKIPALDEKSRATLASVYVEPMEDAALVRIKPMRTSLVSVVARADAWAVTIGDSAAEPVEQIRLTRASGGDGRRLLRGVMPQAGEPVMIEDSDTHQRIAVVPMSGLPHGVLKVQNFVEFRLLRSALGLVVAPRAEDIFVRAELDSVVIGRESGLTLSPDSGSGPAQTAKGHQELVISAETWLADRRGSIRETERDLLRAAANAPKRDRSVARMRLAQFYLANGYGSEAGGVLGLTALEDPVVAQSKPLILFRLVGAIQTADFAEARRLAAHPVLALENEAGLWRGLLDVEARKYGTALTAFRQFSDVLDRYPEHLQAMFRPAIVEAAVEGGDTFLANQHLGDLERLGAEERDPGLVALLQGRISEASGRASEAITAYQTAAKSSLRPIEAQARLQLVLLQLSEHKIEMDRAQAELETIAMIWRRGEIEVRARARLAEIYAADSHWREAFNMTKRAVEILPDHPLTRKLQDDTAQRFEALFLGGKADSLSRIEALAIFDEFRTLIPIGARGDEIVRRLAERLYELDLLDQAAELLSHQVLHRLKGVARAQVATRLAVVHLVNGKPQEALQTLKASRLASIPSDLRRARMMLEARTLAELSRTELAMEVLAAEAGDDIERLRADILWRGKRWRDAAETYERALGDRWQKEPPLSDGERGDVIRAAVAYVLATDRLGADRLRAKYLPKMSDSIDAETFKLVTLDNLSRAQDFREIARSVVSAETLSDFLEAYRKRYPGEAGGKRTGKAAPAG